MCEGLGSGRACACGGWLLHLRGVRDVTRAVLLFVIRCRQVAAGCLDVRSELKVGMCWCWMREPNEQALLSPRQVLRCFLGDEPEAHNSS